MKENVKQYILILEDDEDLSEGICLSLQSPELTFVRCKTVAQAKQLLKERKYDLLILDINLPDGSAEYVEDNAVSVGIRRLRDKLEDMPFRAEYIRIVYRYMET